MTQHESKGRRKVLVLALALVLLVGSVIGGTLAWLTDSTEEVKNTFTTSDINIELEETEGGDEKEFKMVPGCTIDKDPIVTVLEGSEKCYLFVTVEVSDNFDQFLSYEMAEGWTNLEDDVYYRVVDASAEDQAFSVLKDDQVEVKDSVNKEQMEELTDSEQYPTLTVTAYASQYMKNNTDAFTPAEAWDNVNS